MSDLKVVNRKFYRGEGTYIGRPSPWGNDWSHLYRGSAIHKGLASVEDAVFHFADWLCNGVDDRAVQLRHEIMSKGTGAFEYPLICWCVTKEGMGSCHGRFLHKFAQAVDECTDDPQADADESMRSYIERRRHLYTPRCTDCEVHLF